MNNAMDRQTERYGEMMTELRDEVRAMREAFERQSSSGTRSGAASTVEVEDAEEVEEIGDVGVREEEENVADPEVDIEMGENDGDEEEDEDEDEESGSEGEDDGEVEAEMPAASGVVDAAPASPEHERVVVPRPRMRLWKK
jgi:hypothetical protein